jgi:hypothetical protein
MKYKNIFFELAMRLHSIIIRIIKNEFYFSIASELRLFLNYFQYVIQYKPRPEDDGTLLEAIKHPRASVERTNGVFQIVTKYEYVAILLNGNLNYSLDIEEVLKCIYEQCIRSTRLVIISYNPYLKFLYILANSIGLRRGDIPSTFLTLTDLENLCRLTGFQIVRTRSAAYFPIPLFGLQKLLNKFLPIVPLVRNLNLVKIFVLRPIQKRNIYLPSLTVVIPARNERGNIRNAIERLANWNRCSLEVIFVEGHSTDGTWEEIQSIISTFKLPFPISAYKQSGKGKSDAVRLGFSKARMDLITILDADLTMPPELLNRFFDAYVCCHGDFINGSRLLYPMEGQAMRFLNLLGNIFFAKALSSILEYRVSDVLCGTKMLSRTDYERTVAWRKNFGDFDPFGDFELLFPAAVLGLGIIDIPIRYKDRVYGITNINRFKHGLMLLKMTIIGFWRIKLGKA